MPLPAVALAAPTIMEMLGFGLAAGGTYLGAREVGKDLGFFGGSGEREAEEAMRLFQIEDAMQLRTAGQVEASTGRFLDQLSFLDRTVGRSAELGALATQFDLARLLKDHEGELRRISMPTGPRVAEVAAALGVGL